jgi:cytochrome c peroxidase
MQEDAETFGHQFPAYRDNPLAETVRAIEGLESDPDYAKNFAKFYRDMVYGRDDFDFTACMKTLKALSMLLTEQQP